MLIDIVGNFSALMNAHNLSHWVDSGTLLGAIRHQGLIPHDQDSDFGIDEDAYKYLRDSPIEVPEPFVLHVWDSDVNDPGKRDEAIPIRFVNTNSGLYSDVFVFKDWEDRYERPMLGPVPSGCFGDCVRCDSVDGAAHFQVPYEWIYPLVTCKFEHFSTFCPRESIKYIRYLFGDDYMTPQ
ncbi:TPA: hypothetical protein N0F65_000371 [Lagenidium giganteum]|uniref:LicD/FKTN/FKRP nucleotidyltransferase domain-containing protein n=1 Tax=Lagenidium giganteum TaxID=4803 RepID=A0AAV2Z5X3_9STRA|nr:TPA: hypothetical protein N0F65_000371 [Lagenidium giganteum]